VEVTTPPRKRICVQETSEMPRAGLTNRRPGCKEKELSFGTWNVRTLFKTAALLSFVSQLKEYARRPAGRPRTRWAHVVQRDELQLLGIRGWRRRTENRDE